MLGLNRESISTKRICDGWRELNVERCGVRLEGSFKTKQQITVELTYPFVESITIETTEPFSDSTDLANFAEELALVVEHRRRVRRKQKLVDNKELLRTKILPLWFEREEYNDLVRALRGQSDDDDFIDGLAEYNRRLTIALGALDVERGFRLSQHDLRDIFGRKAWEEALQICELNKEVKDSTLHIIARGVENFNRLYNLDPQTIRLGQMRREYDAITTAGFGDIILAAALKKDGMICGVMAIDNVQGRMALRHLVGAEQLVAVLPKRAYNAVMRDERLLMEDAIATESITHEMIVIE